MTLTPSEMSELRGLLSRLCDEDLSSSQASRLESLVLSDEDARSYYLDYLDIHGTLGWLTMSTTTPRDTDKPRDTVENDEAAIRHETALGPHGQTKEVRSPVLGFFNDAKEAVRHPLGVIGLVIVAIATLSIVGVMRFQGGGPQVDVGRQVASQEQNVGRELVARITGMSSDCIWKNVNSAHDDGSALLAEQVIEFETGVVEITFDDESRAIIEGPVRFQLLSASSGDLQFGRLYARAKPGFVIRAPGVTVCDLGTEFGVHVSVPGATRIDVIDGSVDVQGTHESRRLLAGEALAADQSGSLSSAQLVADASDFIRRVPKDSSSLSVLRGRRAHWSLDDGLEDPSATAVVDSIRGRKGAFAKTMNHPLWISGKDAHLGGALLFDGGPQRVDLEPDGERDALGDAVSISAWVRFDVLPSELTARYGSIYDSDEDCYILYLDRDYRELRFKVKTVDDQFLRVGIPEDYLIRGRWHHVAGVYDGERSRALIYLNGVLMKVGVQPNLTGDVKPGQAPYVGRDFVGAIDEITVWSRALTSHEVAFLSKVSTKEDGLDPNSQ